MVESEKKEPLTKQCEMQSYFELEQLKNYIEETPTPSPIKKANKTLILILIINILSIFLSIFLIYQYFQNKNKTNRKKQIICESGYYIPNDDPVKEKCQSCSINNCEKCNGNKGHDLCILCKSNNFAIYSNNIIQTCKQICDIGEGNKCADCNNETKLCSSCNPSYYLIGGECLPYSFEAIYSAKKKTNNTIIQRYLFRIH